MYKGTQSVMIQLPYSIKLASLSRLSGNLSIYPRLWSSLHFL